MLQFYFAALLYSYAIHLRKGSYRSLPRSRAYANGAAYSTSVLPDDDEEDVDDFYRLPVRTPASENIAPSPSYRSGHTPSSSLTNFADFVSAPGRSRRAKPGKSSLSVSTRPGGRERDVEAEVLFDEDAGSSSSRGDRAEDRKPLVGTSSSSSRRGSRSRS